MATSFRLFVGAIVLVVVGSIALGLYMAGSPAKERLRRLDEQRIQDLSQISSAVQQFYGLHEHLPDQLAELKTMPNAFLSEAQLLDPNTHEAYDYRSLTTSTYELCARFDTDSKTEVSPPMAPIYPMRVGVMMTDWNHGIGQGCFPFSIVPIQK